MTTFEYKSSKSVVLLESDFDTLFRMDVSSLPNPKQFSNASAFLFSVNVSIPASKRANTILFVGSNDVRRGKDWSTAVGALAATGAKQLYSCSSWIGGTITNWRSISVSLEHLNKLRLAYRTNLIKNDFQPISNEAVSKHHKSKGLPLGFFDVIERPSIMIVVDVASCTAAVREAQRVGIPVIGLVDDIAMSTIVDYPIQYNGNMVQAANIIKELANWHLCPICPEFQSE